MLEHRSAVGHVAVLPCQAVRGRVSAVTGVLGELAQRLRAAGTLLRPGQLTATAAGQGASLAEGGVASRVSRGVVRHRVAGAGLAVVVEVDVVIRGGAGHHGRGDDFPRFASGVPVAPGDGGILLISQVLTPLPPPDDILPCKPGKKRKKFEHVFLDSSSSHGKQGSDML